MILSPYAMILFSRWGMMAPDGACKTFDAAADGFVRAEGCGVIAIKRLADALAARDPVLAVIRGTAMNSDGKSSGLTVPNGPAQRALLQKALASARLEPADIDYVEAHGTGTSLGDPIEVEALGAALRRGRSPDRPVYIGSIKTNIGHAESASGVAGLLKVVASLRHEMIPAHLHFSKPNPGIPWSDLPLAVPAEPVPWARGARVRRAGVSSFGVSGTNAHAILEEAPALPREPHLETPRAFVVPLAAREDGALRAMAGRLARFAEGDVALEDIALTAATGRAHLARRVAFVSETKADLARDLHAFAEGQTPPTASEGTLRPGERPRWAFLFTGQGAQYAGMGKGLYESEPVFRSILDRAAKVLEGRLPKPLLSVLFPREGEPTPLSETGYTQPALFALEYALVEQWRAWGIAPSAVIGHSVGEYVAAAVAGVMSFEDGLLLIAERGRLMQELPSGGAMAAVFASEAVVAPRVARAARLAIAAVNGPEETVVSGDARAVGELVAAFTAEGVKCKPLQVSHAFHSPLLDPMLDALEKRAAAVAVEPPRIALVSNLTGAAFAPGERPDGAYWRRHAREAVRFAAGIEALRAAGITGLLEVGPHPTLLGLASRSAPKATWATAASLRRGRDDRREMLSALGLLYVRGAAVAWDSVHRETRGRRVAMPTYPFQRERHWLAEDVPAMTARAAAGHPLLGEHRELATPAATHVWETTISLETHPWLRDHAVQGTVVLPASAYFEMALAATAEIHTGAHLAIREIQNLKPLLLREGESRTVQTSLVAAADRGAEIGNGAFGRFTVHSRAPGGPWITHMTGEVAADGSSSVATPAPDLEAIRKGCPRVLEGSEFYASFAEKGNQWGPRFQGLQRVWLGDDQALGEVRVAPALAGEVGRYRFHPAVSDACGHVLVAAASLTREGAFVGGGIDEVKFHRSPSGSTLWVHAHFRGEVRGNDRAFVADLRTYDERGLMNEALGARIVGLEPAAEGAGAIALEDSQYEVRWLSEGASGGRERAAEAGPWIVFADRGGIAEAIRARRAGAAQRTVLVTEGDSFALEGDRARVRLADPGDLRALLEKVPAPAAVLHLASMAAPFEAALAAGPESVVALLQVLLAAGGRRPRLWLLTADTQPAIASDACSEPFGATLWGLGRALSAEHAELWGGLIDVRGADPADRVAEQVIREVDGGGADDQMALRGGERYVPRLSRRAASAGPTEVRARADATYVVTGGLGGIGLAVARWLVERGARHLLLLGRSAPPPREAWNGLGASSTALGKRIAALQELDAMGAQVEIAAIDVSRDGALEACLEARRARGEPPVRGVMHSAGVVQMVPLAAQPIDGLRGAMAAKLEGGWRLHQTFAREPLDFFVLFSSSAALVRWPLLGAYAGANAFLDALAHHRRALGLPALSIDWGAWGEVGMATETAKNGTVLADLGAMSNSRGLAALEALVASGATQAAVMQVDWAKLARTFPGLAKDPFMSQLVGNAKVVAPAPRLGSALITLREASGPDLPGRLVAYLRVEAARTLGMAVESLDPASPLSSMGFDSLMAVQLKNQLEADLGVVVPMIRLLDGPSLNELLPSMLEAMSNVAPRLAAAPAAAAEVWEEGSL